MKTKEWPNGLGFDVKTSWGEWEILKPYKAEPYKARLIPHGERYPSRYGEGKTWLEAMRDSIRVEL